MAQAERELTPYTSPSHYFGAELRHWRRMRGLSQAQLGGQVFCSGHLIGRIEKAERRATPDLVARLDTVLGTGGALARLLPTAEPRPAAPTDIASADADDPGVPEEGLGWCATPAATVASVTGLWRADMRRRSVIGSAWLAFALAEPVGRWLLDPVDVDVQSAGGRRVGQTDVDALWTMCGSFADADRQLGGGYARGTLIHFADQVMAPLLEGAFTESVGRRLFAAAARLCDIAGFMCFDSGHQGLGQRYLIQSLRMAKISGDVALGAHILVDMAMQAHHLRQPHQAVALSEAGVTTARRSGSASTLARCHAMHSRALASQGDARGSDEALNRAERALDHAAPDDEPVWIRFFTAQQLAAESMYAAADLGRGEHVRRHAATALGAVGSMQRRHVLATATLAGSYLSVPGGRGEADVDQACRVLDDVLPTVGSLTSVRALTAVNDIRIRLAPYAARPSVQRLEQALRHGAATA
ncbi:multiprotein-bridging factor 1 family protein [Catellatospora coxensis]|uniref:HTH cro/C1-type domain-containing protein n=1 Tax=Catellatospora coxensis TaxID=310354 RepID=A0A8J3KVV9_9ACTN|nr:helix-turn-helix transcriptional regulator [Catellatospora coxensis]GIG08045.1 hypothetical protein Cco03nite_47450 [Catellatospora coxensis]